MTPPIDVRPGGENDLAAIAAIYNHYVVSTHATFDVEPWPPDAWPKWLAGFALTGPYRLFVAEDAGTIAGYITSKRFRPKAGYDTSVETTVYVHHDRHRRGIGIRLCRKLLDALEQEPHLHRAYAGIALPNDASIHLHEKLGYTLVGTFREVGRKFGKLWDVSWYERAL